MPYRPPSPGKFEFVQKTAGWMTKDGESRCLSCYQAHLTGLEPDIRSTIARESMPIARLAHQFKCSDGWRVACMDCKKTISVAAL